VLELVALDLPAGPSYVEAIRRIWDNGDAFMPIDSRLPATERQRVFDTLAPTMLVDADGHRTRLAGGRMVEPGDALVIATSGTTGLPKGVVHTHASIAASADATSKALNIDPAIDTWLACLPLAHIGGLSVVLRALHTGTPLVIHDGFDAATVMSAVRKDRVTRVSLVTRALQQIDPAVFTTVLLGGAAPPADRPANCIATYGMTETGSGVVYEGWPLDGVELRVDNDEQIWVRGPMLLRAYRSANSDADPKDADGWFPTGDLGFFRDDGRIGVSGRAGDVIVTGGEKVWPSRVEAVIAELPGVKEVVVVGRPDDRWGHTVTAIVVPTDATKPPELGAIRDAVKQSLPVWYAPQVIEIRASLPETDSGKVQRHLL
jgi:o-succinylbenzoate---CoA ligase